METIQVSKAAYEELMSRRIGHEAISTTILRELKPKKSKALEELERIGEGEFYTLSEAEEKFGI